MAEDAGVVLTVALLTNLALVLAIAFWLVRIEPGRGRLPDLTRLAAFRADVAHRVHAAIGAIRDGRVGAPAQLTVVAQTLLTALINHEYQRDQWIGEVRCGNLGHPLPDRSRSDLLTELDGYLVICDPRP